MALGLKALAIFAMASVPVPTGVNGSVLGKPEQFAFQGPGKLCLREASMELEASETAYLEYSGIHNQKIEIASPKGTLELTEGEAWTQPKSQKVVLLRNDKMTVYEIDHGAEFRYLIYGANRYSDGRQVPMIWVDGSTLTGNVSDQAIVSRLVIGSVPSAQCGISYNYGWGVLLEGEPLVMRKDNKTQ